LSFAPELLEDSSFFEDSFFEPLSKIEAGSFWFVGRNRLLQWALARYFPAFSSFLEIGCGTGFVLAGVRERFPGRRLVGSEILPSSFAIARGRLPGVELVQMDARRIPYENEFDVVGAFDVIEHIDEDADVLEQMARAATPGGGVLITVPQHRFLWSKWDDHAHHRRRYQRRDLTEKARRAGLRVERVTSFVSLLMPLMLASRLRRTAPAEFDPLAEHRIGRTANALLSAVMTVERAAIRLGLSFPAGGSLLLVARKPA
jgi:SAM-dependent methyltransferase